MCFSHLQENPLKSNIWILMGHTIKISKVNIDYNDVKKKRNA